MTQNTIFWPALYLPTGGMPVLVAAQHVADRAAATRGRPLTTLSCHRRRNMPRNATNISTPDEGVQDARPRAAAEQVAEEEQAGVEERQARQPGQQQEDERHDPVVHALAVACSAGAWIAGSWSGLPSLAALAVGLPSLDRPDLHVVEEAGQRRADHAGHASGLATPFHSATIGLIVGSFGRPL